VTTPGTVTDKKRSSTRNDGCSTGWQSITHPSGQILARSVCDRTTHLAATLPVASLDPATVDRVASTSPPIRASAAGNAETRQRSDVGKIGECHPGWPKAAPTGRVKRSNKHAWRKFQHHNIKNEHMALSDTISESITPDVVRDVLRYAADDYPIQYGDVGKAAKRAVATLKRIQLRLDHPDAAPEIEGKEIKLVSDDELLAWLATQ
jgi:hypothetical protein